ncbi:MAG: hypothetical protein O7D30_08605 [Rickettsia endosymbiont of Ixodes persulcatus]|nr:hypothetical protein [Rickettsia endosymbiont of Ixodes persulcatus]
MKKYQHHTSVKGELRRFFEQPQLTIFLKSPSFTLSGILFSIAKFRIGIVKSANENDAKTKIRDLVQKLRYDSQTARSGAYLWHLLGELGPRFLDSGTRMLNEALPLLIRDF